MRCSVGAVGKWCVLITLVAAGTACNRSETGGDTKSAADSEESAVTQATHNAGLDTDKGAAHAHLNEHEHEHVDGFTPAPPATNPAQAVTNFLDAVRRGDDGQAESLLTKVARQKTREMDLAVAPPGSPTAKFEVSTTEFPDGSSESAHVASKWSDVDGSGYERTDEIVWILRKELGGWRIGGMATKLFEDQPPLILNFEDPQDMIRKQQSAEAEIGRRAKAEQARLPGNAETTRE